MSEENTIVYILDPNKPPPDTPKRRATIARLAAMKDEDIDYSDAPAHDFEKMPMHRVNPSAMPKGREPEEREKETAGV